MKAAVQIASKRKVLVEAFHDNDKLMADCVTFIRGPHPECPMCGQSEDVATMVVDGGLTSLNYCNICGIAWATEYGNPNKIAIHVNEMPPRD